jgi:hypothetical protein
MKATMAEPELVFRRGKPVSVILPIKDYQELLGRIEDSADVSVSRSHRGNLSASPGEVLQRALARLKANG